MSARDIVPGSPRIRPATQDDLAGVTALLAVESLPAAGVAEWLTHFVVAEQDGIIVGAAGLEMYESGALLRSVVVRGDWKGRGVGGALVDAALAHARDAGRSQAYLLTTTAEHYFPRYGFRAITRADVPEDVKQSAEFREACPVSAAVMVCDLAGARV